MKRFSTNLEVQAKGCWSMVNIALIPRQKTLLLKLEGISVALNTMANHPMSGEVQFRAIFALINLVVTSDMLPNHNNEEDITTAHDNNGQRSDIEDVNDELTEKELIDESAPNIVNSVVIAMKNFCASNAILNRACLVLHNLSLFDEYLQVLIDTPNCYRMLEWCLANFTNEDSLKVSRSGVQ